ncbi:uncharacterized protein K452DRAFT_295813 [Neofusicoccum parvum]|uniref:Uncharacterized protein K452DRAFT_295813 n=1 Tax=Neofusicoccum parvum TaxID=310453 RepID=A0ACB5SCP9_9PEZI|nr:uncharacterized protein K452DRAFT_295813 [Neofusicoccum parvum]
MASSSEASADNFNISRVPVHLEVGDGSALRSFPASGAAWPLTVSICFNAAASSAFAKLRVDFAPKSPPRTLLPLFAFIPPERVVSLSVEDAETPESVRPELRTGLTRLRFALDRPATIVAPHLSALVPKNKASGDILEMLQSLASVSSFTLYLPSRHLPPARAQRFCQMARDGGLHSLASESQMSHLYNGKGGTAYEAGTFTPFAPNAAPAESPPSYDELALSPPPQHKAEHIRFAPSARLRDAKTADPLCSGRSSKKRRTASSNSKPSADPDDARAMRDMCREICDGMKADLRKELQQEIRDELRKEFRTELHQELEVLKRDVMDSIEQRLDERDEKLRQEMHEELSEMWDHVDENKDDALSEAGELVDLRIEEHIDGIKDELQTYISEELKDVEDRIKGDICASNLSLTFD